MELFGLWRLLVGRSHWYYTVSVLFWEVDTSGQSVDPRLMAFEAAAYTDLAGGFPFLFPAFAK
jgi:hypothetical protein